MRLQPKEIGIGAVLLLVVIVLVVVFGSGSVSDEPAPEELAYDRAEFYCQNKGGRLPTSGELKKSGKIGWTSNLAPKENNMILRDETQHECILQPGQAATFCADSKKLPVYCFK